MNTYGRTGTAGQYSNPCIHTAVINSEMIERILEGLVENFHGNEASHSHGVAPIREIVYKLAKSANKPRIKELNSASSEL